MRVLGDFISRKICMSLSTLSPQARYHKNIICIHGDNTAFVTKVLQAHHLVGPAIAANHAKDTSNPTNSDYKPLMTLLDKSDSKGS